MRFKEFKEANDFLAGITHQWKPSSDLIPFSSFSFDKKSSAGADTPSTATSGTATPGTEKPGAEKNQQNAKPNSKKSSPPVDIKDTDFDKKLVKVANKLGINPVDLKTIIKVETAGTFSPTSHDPWNVSIGLIGFTSNTAKALGTTKAELAQMTAVQQLDYVYKFYKMNGLRPGSDRGTIYMLTFMPAYAYHPDNTVLGKKNGPQLGKTGLSMHKIWLQNPGFGKSKGKDFFTVGDVKNLINSR
jgi:hypothetical protein